MTGIRCLAVDFAALWKREKALEKERRRLAARLCRRMRRVGSKAIMVGPKEAVVLVTDARKTPSLKDLGGFFGTRRAETFWGLLEARICEYLTVVKAKAQTR